MTNSQPERSPSLPSTEQELISPKITPDINRQADAEQTHEIVALEEVDGEWKLNVSEGYRTQWATIEGELSTLRNLDVNTDSTDSGTSLDIQTPDFLDDNVFTISFLGNTSTGKSYLVRHILDKSCGTESMEGPVSIHETEKQGATTVNINCYISEFIAQQKILLLDYEGEKGPGFPLLHYAQRHLANISRTAEKAQKRRQTVTDYFPKLAYILSDVVVLIGTDDLTSTDYLHRCQEFALRANEGVSQVIKKPMLIIVQNKAPVIQSIDNNIITETFLKIHGEEGKHLERYFSSIKCFVLPHREQLQRVNSVTWDGEKIFDDQIMKLKDILRKASEDHLKQTPLTHAQWLYLLQHVLPIVQSGKSISLHTLLSKITEFDDNPIIETSRRCFLHAYDSKPIHTPAWFDDCCQLAMYVLAYCLAAQNLSQYTILPERIVKEQCDAALEKLSSKLKEFLPCEAIYPGKGRLSTDNEGKHPIYCYQHKGAHQSGHRTCQAVYGLTIWSRFLGRASMDVWSGEFSSSRAELENKTIFLETIMPDLSTMVTRMMHEFQREPNARYTMFYDLLINNSCKNPTEIFNFTCLCQSNLTDRPCASYPIAAHREHQNRQQNSRTRIQRFLSLFRRAPHKASDVQSIKCQECYQQLTNASNNRPLQHGNLSMQ